MKLFDINFSNWKRQARLQEYPTWYMESIQSDIGRYIFEIYWEDNLLKSECWLFHVSHRTLQLITSDNCKEITEIISVFKKEELELVQGSVIDYLLRLSNLSLFR